MPAVHFQFGSRLAAAFTALILFLCPALIFAQTRATAVPPADADYREPEGGYAETENDFEGYLDIGGPKIHVFPIFDLTDKEQSRIFYRDAARIESVFSGMAQLVSVFWNQEFYHTDEEWFFNLPPNLTTVNSSDFIVNQLRIENNAYSPDYNVFSEAIEFLKKKKVGEKDAVFIFWSGHGVVQNGRHYLMQANGKSIPRQEMLDAAKGCGARLTVLITDSCASLKLSGRATSRKFPESAPAAAGVPPLFEELFFNYRGVLNVNSCSEGERAYSYDIRGIEHTDEDGRRHIDYDPSGGCFSLALTGETVGYYPFYRQLINVVNKNAPSTFPSSDDTLDPQYTPFGAFPLFCGERKSWREMLDYTQSVTNVIFHNIPNYKNLNQRDQHIAVFETPTRITATPKPLFSKTIPPKYLGGDVDDYDKLAWSKESIYSPEVGDEILEINGIPIYEDDYMEIDFGPSEGGEPDYDDYPDDEEEEEDMGEVKRNRVYTLVKDSPDVVVIKFKDRKSGKNYYFRTKLGPKGSVSRLGLTPALDKKGAVVVGSIVRGSSAQKGQFAWE